MATPGFDTRDDADLPPVPLAGFVLAWVTFWALLVMIAVQDFLREGQTGVWKPLLWEGTSFLVASVILGTQWLRLHRHDHLLGQHHAGITRCRGAQDRE